MRTTSSKVIAAFLLTCVAIAMAMAITYFSFRSLLVTVDDLTAPNIKVKTLNNLFQQITQLDQKQRAEAILNPGRSYSKFLRETQTLTNTLDTLMQMHWGNEQQILRLKSMQQILRRRNELFLSYLRIKSEFTENARVSSKLDTLSKIISKSYSSGDTTVTTTQKTTTTTTYHPVEEKKETERSFFNRLFSRKKNDPDTDTRIEVEEEFNVKIDTIAISKQDSAASEVTLIMKRLEQAQKFQNQRMLRGEFELITTNAALVSQLLRALQEVEKEEQLTQAMNSEKAFAVVSKSIKRIGIIIILFFLGAALLVFLIIADITKSNSLRKQLIKAKEDAEYLGHIKQRFLANMSHEIRTPLQSIIGFAEQIKLNPSKDIHAIEAIHSSSEHLLHIVNEILDYSRIDSGKLNIEHEPFDLALLITEVHASMRVQAERKNISFILEFNATRPLRMIGDAFRLRQILYNLLANAIKFTDKGFVKLSVDAVEKGNKTACRFVVQDSGIGMRQNDIQKAFELFEQAHSTSRLQGGAGLGLTIVKKLIEVQSGKLQVESIPEKGSTFMVELDYDKDERTPVTPKVPEELPVAFSGKIAIVDDDATILKLTSLIFEKHHINYTAYNDAVLALEKIPEENFEILLLDIRMPGIGGAELCQKLRKKLTYPIRIVALTAHVLPEERSSLITSGFDHVLTKPFKESDLLQVIQSSETSHKNVEERHATFDFTLLRKMTLRDESLFRSVLLQFVEETSRDMVILEKSMRHQDAAEVQYIVHKMAGRCGQIGASDISAAFKTIEVKLLHGDGLKEVENDVWKLIQQTYEIISEFQMAAG